MYWLESLLDNLSHTGLCYSDQALSEEQRNNWLQTLKVHRKNDYFKPASIGREATLQKNNQIRNDEISWLQTSRPEDAAILKELELWKSFLNQSLFLSMRTIEAHFACYDPGHFYKRHKDQHDSKTSRIISFVIYLHPQWKKADGGEFAVTDGDRDHIVQIIEPLPGRVVLFKSDQIWHQVQKSNFARTSLTGWFRHDENPLGSC